MLRTSRWLSALAIGFGALASGAREQAPTFSADRYVAHVKYLASPELGGRASGSPGLEKAARYIEKQFRSYGLKPVPGQKSYRQEFTVTVNARLGKKNSLEINGRAVKPEKEYLPVSFSSTGEAAGGLVFAGYGITAKEYNYDDYAGIDVKDKFVVVLRHEPQEMDEKSVFAGKNFTSHAQFAMKASNAKAHGARAVIIVNDAPTHPKDEDKLDRFGSIEGPGNAGIFLLEATYEEAGQWFATSGRNLKDAITVIDHLLKPQSFAFPENVKARASVEVKRETRPVHNLAAYLPGETEEYAVVGAHYDHLGMGGAHSLAPSEHKGHPGADDNASGTAGMLELARWFAAQGKHRRGVLFLAFAGEELGLLGSQYYVSNPELPLDKAVAMINMDMIGRMRDSKIYMSGVGTGSTFQKLVDDAAPKHGITLDLSEKAGYGSSDHTSFTTKQVPVLFFFSGLHADYHKPSDTWEKIDGESAAKLLGLVGDLTTRLADGESRPEYVRVQEAPVGGVGGGGRGYGPYFGSIPDFTELPNGVRFADVREGSPAGKAGLKAGDILTEFDGSPISNLYDFTRALQSKKPGEEVLVKVIRDGKSIEAKVLLTQRK
jgi:hypothetical protein